MKLRKRYGAEKMAEISVIVPVYNTREYIEKCLDSIVNQTYRDLEIICVDDGSTDGTSEILQKYAEKDSRIKIVRQQNRGVVFARKTGIKAATGRLISFIDSDDWIDCRMYETLYRHMTREDVDTACCALCMVKGETESIYKNGIEEGIYGKEEIYKCLYDVENARECLNWSYHTYLLKKDKIYPYVMLVDDEIMGQGEDIVGMWCFLANADSIYVDNSPFYYYRLRTDSASHKENEDYLIRTMKTYKIIKREFEKCEHSKELVRTLKHAVFNLVQDNTCFSVEKQPFFLFPYEKLDRNKKIVLYGAGIVGKSYFRQLCENHYCDIVLWVDREFQSIRTEKYPVCSPDEIKRAVYDYILISGVNVETSKQIREFLKTQYDIEEDKILVCEPKRMSKFVNLD